MGGRDKNMTRDCQQGQVQQRERGRRKRGCVLIPANKSDF